MQQIFRIAIMFCVGLCVMVLPAHSEEIPARSPLGIDYMALTEGDAQLASILLTGEAEFTSNVADSAKYQKLGIERAWNSYSKNIKKENITNIALGELQQYTPEMLSSFIDLPKERYPLLRAIGDRVKSEEMLERAKLLSGQ